MYTESYGEEKPNMARAAECSEPYLVLNYISLSSDFALYFRYHYID